MKKSEKKLVRDEIKSTSQGLETNCQPEISQSEFTPISDSS